MVAYEEVRKKYCECCDSCSFCKHELRTSKEMEKYPNFIHWEIVAQSKSKKKTCDAIYDLSGSKLFFIEFKNFIWFLKNDLGTIIDNLQKKFEASHKLYFADGNECRIYEDVCAFDTNENPYILEQMSSLKYQTRNIMLSHYSALAEQGITLIECLDAFSPIVYS